MIIAVGVVSHEPISLSYYRYDRQLHFKQCDVGFSNRRQLPRGLGQIKVDRNSDRINNIAKSGSGGRNVNICYETVGRRVTEIVQSFIYLAHVTATKLKNIFMIIPPL